MMVYTLGLNVSTSQSTRSVLGDVFSVHQVCTFTFPLYQFDLALCVAELPVLLSTSQGKVQTIVKKKWCPATAVDWFL